MIKITNIEDEDVYLKSDINIEKYSKYKIIEIVEFNNNIFKEIYNYQLKGYKTIIKYPEINKNIKRNPNLINSFIDSNCLFILDINSLIGKNGIYSKNLSKKFVKLNIYNFINKRDLSEEKISCELDKYLHLKDILKESINSIEKNENINFIGVKLKYKGIF